VNCVAALSLLIRAEGMLAEFGTERRKKSSIKQQADSQLYSVVGKSQSDRV
jgi:hypothetical protein